MSEANGSASKPSRKFGNDGKDEEVETLSIGDFISLYDEERHGFVMSYQSSKVHNELVIAPDQSREYPILPNVQTIQFEICVPHRYKCNKTLPQVRSLALLHPENVNIQTRYEIAKKLAAIERTDNVTEMERQVGKQLLYGQTIQLRHAFTHKWIHVNPIQTAITEPSSMMVELRSDLGKSTLFRVLPRSKVKTEGEPVQIGDRVIFESIKTPGQYLHSGRMKMGTKYVCSDCYELNLSVRQTGFAAYLSNHGAGLKDNMDPRSYAVTNGAFVRMFHREAEAYLCLEGIDDYTGEDVHLRVRRFDPNNPKTMHPSTSAINYWQIEKEPGASDCEKIKSDDLVKLRHAVSRQYLCIKDGTVKMTADFSDDELMYFRLIPVVKRSPFLTLDTSIRIQHVETKLWVHGAMDQPYVSRRQRVKATGTANANGKEKLGKEAAKDAKKTAAVPEIQWTTAERKQVLASKEMQYDDAFALQIIPAEHVWEMNFVAGMVPFLHKLCNDIANGYVSNLSARLISKIEQAINELEEFCFIDGIPCKRRQKLLRNFMIVDVGVQLLKHRTGLLNGSLQLPGRDSSKSAAVLVNSYLEPVFIAVIALLSAYAQGESRKNELYLGRHLNFFLTQIQDTTSPIGLTATQMTCEVLHNNRKMVDRFTKTEIDKVVAIVKSSVNYRQLDLLSALCDCNGAALTRNQDYIAEKLVLKPVQLGENVLLLTDLGQNIGRRRNAVYVSWDNGRGWQVLHDFTAQSQGTDHYLFLKYQLKLYVALCKGRNSNVAELLIKKCNLVSWEQCYICLTDRKLADDIRAVYCQLLFELFVNVGSNFIQATDLDTVYLYDHIPSAVTSKQTLQLTQETPKTSSLDLEFMEPLKLWMNDFLVENDTLVASDLGRNELIQEVLIVLPKLVRLGYYEDSEVRSVLVPILGLLDSGDDMPYRVENMEAASDDVQKMVAQFRETGRYENNPKNAGLTSVKIAALNAAELFFNLRTSVRLNRFLSEFKEICNRESSKRRHKLGPMLHDSYELNNNALNKAVVNKAMEIFEESNYLAGMDFVGAVVDLCHYKSPMLVENAIYILNRFHSSFQDMLRYAGETQLLITDRSREVHDYVQNNLRELRLMLADGNIDAANGSRMKELLESFALLCFLDGDIHNDCHPINQQMLYNSGVLGDIFDIITGHIDTEAEVTGTDLTNLTHDLKSMTLYQVYQSCFILLRAMARGNHTVQQRLFDRMSAFFKIEGVEDFLSELYVEIFSGNKSLCVRVPGKMITEVVIELARSHNPVLLRLLVSLVMIDQQPVKRNQQLVIKALLQYKKSVEIVTETTSASLVKIMAQPDGTQDIQKRYLANVVQLLAYCSHGDNKTVESICQTMFTLQHLLDIILLPTICDGMRAPFVQFLVTVFFTSDLEIAAFEMKELSHEPKLWTYIDGLCLSIKRCTEAIQREPIMAKNNLKRRPTRVHVSNDDTAHEFKETLHYIFDGVLPFLHIFYQNFFQRFDDAISIDEPNENIVMMTEVMHAEQTISSHLLRNALIPFAHAVRSCIGDQYQLTTLLQALHSIIDSTGISEAIPPVLSQPLQTSARDPMQRYQTYYAEEQRLNSMLCSFVENVRLAYSGPNTVRYQIGHSSDAPYCELNTDTELPLGKEFQDLVHSFCCIPKDDEEDTLENRWKPMGAVISHVGNTVHRVAIDERSKLRTQELCVRSIKLIRAAIHNEIVKVPNAAEAKGDDVAAQLTNVSELQVVMVDMGLVEALTSLLSQSNEEITREALACIVAVLNGGNEYVQDRFMANFLSNRDDPFFEALKLRMVQAAEALREKRMIESNRQATEKIKKMVDTTDGQRKEELLDRPMSMHELKQQLPPELLRLEMGDQDVDTLQAVVSQGPFGRLIRMFRRAGGLNKKPTSEPGQEDENAGKIVRTPATRRHDIAFMSNPITCPQALDRMEIMNGLKSKTKIKDHERAGIFFSDAICHKKVEVNMMIYSDPTTDIYFQSVKDQGSFRLVLQVLASLCDGQNDSVQNYLRDQWDNHKTIDLVAETCEFLQYLVDGTIRKEQILMITELIGTVIEMVQGNEANQIAAFDHKVLDHVLPILRTNQFPGCTFTQIYELKRSIGILLVDMTEENSVCGHTKTIMESCNKHDFLSTFQQTYDLLKQREYLTADQEDLALTVGFLYHHLLCRAFDLEPDMPKKEFTDTEAFRYYMGQTMSVELAKGDTLQRVYFTVEDVDVLRRAVKERVKWEVDRSSASNKLRDFMAWSREVCDDIRYQRKVQSFGVCRWLVNNWALLNITMLLLTFVINLVVLFGWMNPAKFDPEYKYSVAEGNFWPTTSDHVGQLIKSLGYLHICLCSLLCASFLLANRPTVPPWMRHAYSFLKNKLRPKRHNKIVVIKRKASEDDEDESAAPEAPETSYLAIDLFSFDGLYYPFLLTMSVLATYNHGAWFCIHMLHIVSQNQLLRRAVQAITLNGRSMLWVCFLGIIWLYIYALIGFLFLRNIFMGNQLYADTMWECFVSTLRNGLMFGMADHFDIPDDDENNEFAFYGLKMIYDLSFFALVTTIGLNMIFGIIIDTFSQLREAKFQIEQDMMSNCFICNRHSYEFEHHGRGFRHHVKVEHNMWAYMFFFIHLTDSPANDLTSLEYYVHSQIGKDSWEFFPLGKALSLMQWEDDNTDTRIQKLMDQVNFLVDHIKTEEDAKARALLEAQREAKRQAQRTQSSWFKRKKNHDAPQPPVPRAHHSVYGPYMIKLNI